jgi:GNAT superfamily N-acetyltransferase
MADWAIRAARREDAEGFVRAHEAAWDAAGVVEQRLSDLVPFEQRIRAFEDGLTKVGNDAQVWITEREEQIIGLVTCTCERGTAVLRDLYVVPEAWGSGVAAALHETALGWMRNRADEAILWVGEANARARRFYERKGWRADGERRASSLGPPELRYRLPL